jgi:hypothetical protein
VNGSIDIGQVVVEVVPVLAATPVNGSQPGLDVAWFDIVPGTAWLPDFSALTPYATSSAATVAWESTGGEFGDSGRAEFVGAVLTGWLDAPATAAWTIHAESDDGSRVWIDGNLVVDNDGLHPMVNRSGTVALAAGKHAIRIHFFENGGGAVPGELIEFGRGGVDDERVVGMLESEHADPVLDLAKPHVGIDELGEDRFFDGTGGLDLQAHFGLETALVGRILFRKDEDSEAEAVPDVVAGRLDFSRVGLWAGGVLGVGLVGQDLCGGGHG